MNSLREIYARIRSNRWSTVAFFTSIGIVGLSTIKVVGLIILGVLTLLTTSSALAVALMVIVYLVYRGVKDLWTEHRGGSDE